MGIKAVDLPRDQADEIIMLEFGGERIGNGGFLFLLLRETDSLQGVPQEDVFLSLLNGKATGSTATALQQVGEQGTLYEFSRNTAGHSKLFEDEAITFYSVLTEAHNAVLTKVVATG